MQIGEIEAVCHISDNGHFAGDVISNPRELHAGRSQYIDQNALLYGIVVM
jgi:hypothetical protein